MGKKHDGNRQRRTGLARIVGGGKGAHSEQKKPHVPQKVITQGPYAKKPTRTKSTKKEE